MRKKKYLIFVLILGFLVFILGLNMPNTYAKNMVPSDYCTHEEYENNYSFQPNRVFNHISPYQDGELSQEFYRGRLRTTFDDLNFEIWGEFIVDATLRVKNKTGFSDGTNINLRAVVNISSNKIIDIEYQYDYETFYRYVVSEELENEYTPFEGFDLCNYYGKEVNATIAKIKLDYDSVNTYPHGRSEEAFSCYGYLFKNMIFIDYSLITTDNTISVDYRNPISMNKIVDTLGMKINDNPVYNYEIIGNNYNENTLSVGNYIISLRAIDSDKNIYIKNIIVSAIDYNPIRNNTIITTYYNPLNRNNIIDLSYIEVGYKDITFETNYLDSINICGEYDYSIEIVTNDNNIYKRKGKIIVNDDVAPTIIGPDYLETDTEHRMTYTEILSHYRAYDEYSNDGITLDLAETNSPDKYYHNNYNLAGNYGIQIIASDKYGNVKTKDIMLYVSNYYHNDPVVTSSSTSISSSSEAPTSSSEVPSSSSTSIPNTTSENIPTETSSNIPTTTSSQEYTPTTSNVIPSTSSDVTSSSDVSSSSDIPSTSVPTTTSTIPSTSSTSSIPSTSSEVPSTTTSNKPVTSTTSTNTPSTSTWSPVVFTSTSKSETTTSITPSTTTQNPVVSPTTTSTTTTPKTSTWVPIDYGNSSTKTSQIVEESKTTPTTQSTWIPVEFGKSTTTQTIAPATISSVVEPTTVETSLIPTTVNEPTNIVTSNITSTSKENKTFVISTTTSKKLSIDNIKNDLLANGLITQDELDSVEIETNYFDSPDMEGYYILTVKHFDGAKDNYILKVTKEEKSVDNKDNKNNNNIFIYMIIAGSSALLILIVILVVVIVRRKKREKAN